MHQAATLTTQEALAGVLCQSPVTGTPTNWWSFWGGADKLKMNKEKSEILTRNDCHLYNKHFQVYEHAFLDQHFIYKRPQVFFFKVILEPLFFF